MKKFNILFICVIIFHFSCKSVNYWKLEIEIPRVTSINLDQYKELIITNFLIEKETKDLNLNKELNDFFSSELAKNYKGQIVSKEISWEKKDLFKNKEFWQTLLPESEETVFLTGDVQFSQETRKAILDRRTMRSADLYLTPEKGLAQRKFFTLVLNLYLINSKSGELIYERNFKESKGYPNPKQTANFAFFDLMERVRLIFFRTIFGEEKIQQRYLITD
ncbi:MAG: hypothetical protein ACETWK_12325 [Candidatus Aminicenantaceae bacterium]